MYVHRKRGGLRSTASPSAGAVILLIAGAVLLAAGLAGPAARLAGGDLLSKAVAEALLVGAGALVTGSGAALGRLARAESRLEAAANRSMLERERLEEEGPAAWEERLASPVLLPWTPAGSRTVMSDLARALWLRGRDGEFPERGDLLTILGAGAYGFAMASNYNTRPLPPEVIVDGGSAWLARPRQLLDDLFDTERTSP